jgi:putative DNA primase/helicase
MTAEPLVPDDVEERQWRFEVRDQDGVLQAVHCRIDRGGSKRMWWELPDGTIGLRGRPSSDLPLYRTETFANAPLDAWVWLVEGEKAADALAESGRWTVATVTGASTIPAAGPLGSLRGRQVVVWADNDDPGREHAARLAAALSGICAAVMQIEWKGAPDHGDAWDYLRFHSPADLGRLLSEAKQVEIPVPTVDVGAEGDGLLLVPMASVAPEAVRWLWEGRIASGKLAIVDGDPGLGKTTLLLDIAARISRGRPMPDGRDGVGPGNVVILTAEDGLADTIRPRLDAAGADLDRIFAIGDVDDRGTPRLASIPEDVGRIEAAIARHHPALLIFDPFVAYLGERVNANRDQDVRRALAPLAKSAERTGVAVVVVRHLRKASSDQPLYRGGGSIGIIGAARIGLLVAHAPNDESTRILAVTKCNLGPIAPAIAFHLEFDGAAAGSRVVWEGSTSHTAAELLVVQDEEQGQRRDAEVFLQEVLGAGAVLATEVLAESRWAGISPRTLRRAKAALRVVSRREGWGGRWSWALPGTLPSPPVDGHERNLALYGVDWPSMRTE